ncbi:MAG: baseplate J/gp47 family protein [Patescibacteria group bacterium]
MAKDYFQDIMPPSHDPEEAREIPIRHSDEDEIEVQTELVRGIRNISSPARMRPAPRPVQVPVGDEREIHRPSRLWIWAVAAVLALVLSVFALLMFRSTSVTITPKSRLTSFTDTILYNAYPAGAADGSLPYTVQSFDIEDSEVVPSQGTVHVERKASGSITVFNEHSSAVVRLIKNTRFETPEGLIFRTPADIVVPGKTSAGPGTVNVTVVADQVGEKYNIGPVARFNLPGLKSGEMYTKVYAKSNTAMSGGFAGEEPGTAPGALNAAIAAVRGRLESNARESVRTLITADSVAFPEIVRITYQSLPNTQEAGPGVRIHEKAHVEVPILPADVFAAIIAQSTAADTGNSSIKLIPGKDFGARLATTAPISLGADPLTFVLIGQARLVWNVDEKALAEALAGHDSDAFQTIVNGFSGVQEAHARIEPFWKKAFPKDAADIKITIKEFEMEP